MERHTTSVARHEAYEAIAATVEARCRAAELPARAVEMLRMLHAVDCFPRGGLTHGYFALQAALRYECVWLPALRSRSLSGQCMQLQEAGGGAGGKGTEGLAMVPPLDIAFAWFVHRQDPLAYTRCSANRRAWRAHPDGSSAFAFSDAPAKAEAWRAVAGGMPYWPPPLAGSQHDLTQHPLSKERPQHAVEVAESMQRVGGLLHSWLRPQFLDSAFLQRAVTRYARFIALRVLHPDAPQPLVPPADVALMWHAHMGLSGDYAAMCLGMPVAAGPAAGAGPGTGAGAGLGRSPTSSSDGASATSDHQEAASSGRLSGAVGALLGPDYLLLPDKQRARAQQATAALFTATYGEPYEDPDTAWVPYGVPYVLADAKSPLAFAFRVFETVPDHQQQQAAASAAAAYARAHGASHQLFASSQPGTPVKQHSALGGLQASSGALRHRSGAHLLFAAWLSAHGGQRFFNDATCHGWCFRSSWAMRVGTIEHTAKSLVGLSYFVDLPAHPTHPYLMAIRQRTGLWGQRTNKDAAPPSVNTLCDAEAYLDCSELAGLTKLVELAADDYQGGPQLGPSHREGAAALWVILSRPEYDTRARSLVAHLSAKAEEHGIDRVLLHGSPSSRRMGSGEVGEGGVGAGGAGAGRAGAGARRSGSGSGLPNGTSLRRVKE